MLRDVSVSEESVKWVPEFEWDTYSPNPWPCPGRMTWFVLRLTWWARSLGIVVGTVCLQRSTTQAFFFVNQFWSCLQLLNRLVSVEGSCDDTGWMTKQTGSILVAAAVPVPSPTIPRFCRSPVPARCTGHVWMEWKERWAWKSHAVWLSWPSSYTVVRQFSVSFNRYTSIYAYSTWYSRIPSRNTGF